MALHHNPRIVTDGLVLALDAADINSYPGSGTTWYDLSGNGNNGTLTNGPTYSSNSIVLDGTNDYIYTSSANTLGNLSNHTFEIWFKTQGLGTSQTEGGLVCPDYGMISTIDANGKVRYSIYSTDNGAPGSGGAYLGYITATGISVFDNEWHHVICTCQLNDSLYIYIDGILQTSGGSIGSWSGSTIWSSMTTFIGRNPNNTPYNFYGNIASTKIYTKYFTASEVLQNYNATKTRFGL